MRYRRLGASGLKVSELSLGSWISFHDSDNMTLAEQIIDQAYEEGINFFDTSNAYHEGHAERILGRALKKYPRDSYVIATKVFWPTGSGPNCRGLSRKHIFDQVQGSIKRLGVDYIDLYYCHWFDGDTTQEETQRAMDDLVTRGLVLYVGVSNWTAAQIVNGCWIADRLGLHKVVANQPSYNMLDRYIEAETIPVCTRNGIGQVVYSPLAQGVLTGKYKPNQPFPEGSRAVNPLAGGAVSIFDYLNEPTLAVVQELGGIADQAGIPLSELALRWVLRTDAVSSALIGASNKEQVIRNARACEGTLSKDLLEAVEGALSHFHHRIPHNIVPWGDA